MADQPTAAPVSRRMKYPYTMTSKIVQFPWKFHFKTNWIYRYYIYGIIVCIPIFYKIQKLSYHPTNVANWEATKRKHAAAHEH